MCNTDKKYPAGFLFSTEHFVCVVVSVVSIFPSKTKTARLREHPEIKRFFSGLSDRT